MWESLTLGLLFFYLSNNNVSEKYKDGWIDSCDLVLVFGMYILTKDAMPRLS
jgi:hypothetical protein